MEMEKYIEFQIMGIWNSDLYLVEGMNDEQIEAFAQRILPNTKYRVTSRLK